ncbi:hypothetical protein [Bacillus methanolicus]|nr:hypothetical protein [Bacillus methanolicus]EIJ82659.1 hypothetical protein MGA3_05470 [Bacillus methanolicus MGA3]
MTNDQIYEFDDIKILIHSKDFVYFDHTKLDYVKDVFGNGRFQLIRVGS